MTSNHYENTKPSHNVNHEDTKNTKAHDKNRYENTNRNQPIGLSFVELRVLRGFVVNGDLLRHDLGTDVGRDR